MSTTDPRTPRAPRPSEPKSGAGIPRPSGTGSPPEADAAGPDAAHPPSAGPELRARNLHLAYDGRPVVEDLDLHVPTGRITAIVGANACGKSTLLRALARLLTPRQGVVELDGVALRSVPTRELARTLGILPQTPVAPEGLTVFDLVGRGRSPHQTWWRQWSAADEEAVHGALAATGLTDLADRPVDELSGGQRQRAWIAMAVAQGTPVLLLDEPTTYLDLAHQIDVLDLITDLNRREGRTVVMVLHDLNQACRYADHVIAMKAGRIVAEGAPAEVVTEATVEDVFDLRCRITPDPVSGTPLVIPLGRHHHDGAVRAGDARPAATVD
ncbi:ABC transporter ATP-binding protein [Streptomyces sp. NPDC060002]|uniref:ABC transporter ATP-binding protein n=1 Tax=Streptomyces sp. NPDC060002 TaxID=3347033 RepID=UPI00368B9E1C